MKGGLYMEKYYTTTQFAREIGVVKNTIVNWEKKGLLLPHHVTPTGRRFYSQQQVNDFFNTKGSDS